VCGCLRDREESAGFEGGAGVPGIVVDRAAVALYECRCAAARTRGARLTQ